MSTTTGAKLGIDLRTPVDALCIQVSIERAGPGRQPVIVVHEPQRAEPMIYRNRPSRTPTPGLAREAMWICLDLQDYETLRIEPKAANPRMFRWDEFDLDREHPVVNTEHAKALPANKTRVEWKYNLVLEHAKLGVIARQDPVIVIVEDP